MSTRAFLAAILLLAGCNNEGWLRVIVASRELSVPTHLDTLRVEIVAAESDDTSADAAVCRPAVDVLPRGAERLAFPVTLLIHPNEDERWSCVGLRLRGLHEEIEVIRAEDFFCPDLAEGTEERIVLDRPCHADVFSPACAPGEVCRPDGEGGSECIPSPVGSLFDAPVSDSELCNSRFEEGCGDGSCNENETVSSCPEDCPAVCGDGLCTHDESWCTCEECDICGDGLCSFREAGADSCRDDCEDSGENRFVALCAGTFDMGSPEEEIGRHRTDEGLHSVTLTHNFAIQMTEVTREQFDSLMGYDPSLSDYCGDSCPVEHLTWHQAAWYANAMSEAEGFEPCYSCRGAGTSVWCDLDTAFASPYECPGYRLPTEAEWEYAARAGTTTATYNGDLDETGCDPSRVLDPIAWWCGNSDLELKNVGTREANPWGLYDMLGNAWEWCHDWLALYPAVEATDPWGPLSGVERATRGGSISRDAVDIRAAIRSRVVPDGQWGDLGFRLARSLE